MAPLFSGELRGNVLAALAVAIVEDDLGAFARVPSTFTAGASVGMTMTARMPSRLAAIATPRA